MKKTIIFCLLFLCTNIYSQDKLATAQIQSDTIDYCLEIENLKPLIGTKAKIYHNGGIFSSMNGSENIKWPNDEIKMKAGKSSWGKFYPKTGDIGQIVSISKSKYDEIIYILQIDKYYVPIKCNYLTSIYNLSSKEESEKFAKEWQAKRDEYGKGDCIFKKCCINDVYNRPGILKIDSISEDFACNLKSNGVDTLMLIKSIFHYEGPEYSLGDRVFIFWYKNNEGYLREYKYNDEKLPFGQTRRLEWLNLIKYFNKKNINQNSEIPEAGSHLHNTIVQFKLGDEFFNYDHSPTLSKKDEKLVTVKFVKMIWRKINE